MLNVLSCIATEHNPFLLFAAVTICVVGSVLTMRLFSCARNTRGVTRLCWLALSGIVGGSTIWTTHFVSMLGYSTGFDAGYEPVMTLLSLGTAIVATTLGFFIATAQVRGPLVEAGGVLVGLGIALMHYMGMSAYQVYGDLVWNQGNVIASLIAGAVFGALATSRIGRPITPFCRYGAVLAFVMAIALTHFISMAGLTIIPNATSAVPMEIVPAGILAVVVVAVMIVILLLGAVSYLIDFQSTRASVERYRHLSMHDALTGLPNRAALMDRLEAVIDDPDGRSPSIALVSFDLDRFKEINDVHGHAAGDHVLRVVAERVSLQMRPDEFLGRVGGDEFLAIKSSYFTRSGAAQLAERLIAAICEPIAWNNQQLTVGSSVGISVYPNMAETADDLLAQADIAMYRAKANGSNNVCVYDVSMDQAARERSVLAMDLREALQAQQFELYYQKQNDTASGEVIGFEALIRWSHPRRGFISPVDFISIAEKTGLINNIGDWVLERACREAASWRNPLSVAVNVAPGQLADNNLPARVGQILKETGLDPKRLELEITESGIIRDQQRALVVIRQLKSLGVRIAMDDYGTGYSSLSTLQLFPFDKIKIDRSFIESVSTNRQSAAIVRSTLILAASLDIPVLAEGVETEESMSFLRQEGCQQVQGFLYGRPLPRAGIERDVNDVVEVKAGEPEPKAAPENDKSRSAA